jgi:hypothetical protein
MEIFEAAPGDRFVASTTPAKVEIISEPFIVVTRFGYLPMVKVKNIESNAEQCLLIGSQSITTALEELRLENEGKLSGLKLAISKESEDKKSKYVIAGVDS